jgi:hypothetical protein
MVRDTYSSEDKDIVLTPHRNTAIQFLIEHIDTDKQTKIDSLQNPNRCILLVGKDENLAKGIVSYIYLTKGMKFFEAVDCSGIDDETMRRRFFGDGQFLSDLPVKRYIKEMQSLEEPPFSVTTKKRDRLLENNVFHWFCLGHTLFLWNLDLKGKDHSLLRPLAIKIADICNCKEHGMLIVSTLTPLANIPKYFTSLFDDGIIELEPAKQDTPVSTPQDTAERQDLKFTYNKQSRTLTFNGNNGKGMKLSKKRAKLFESLKKHRNIRWILKELYSEKIKREEKVIDNKSGAFYSFASKFNKRWRNHFKLNDELELIKCKDEIVSIIQKIDWK